MKYIFIFLAFSSLCFSQTYEDLEKITSVETFKRFVIEEGYEKLNDNINPKVITYAKAAPVNFGDKVNYVNVAFYYQTEEENRSWRFVFYNFISNDYRNLFNYVKAECEFSEIIERKGLNDPTDIIEFAVYNCDGIGKLGFAKSKGAGFVHYFSKK